MSAHVRKSVSNINLTIQLSQRTFRLDRKISEENKKRKLFQIRYITVLRNLLAQFQREETQLFVLRVMVGLVILYDHVHPRGAFVKGSNVDVSIDRLK